MIVWRKFDPENLQEIVDKVGMMNDRISKPILVMVKFEHDSEYEPRFANVTQYTTLPKQVSVNGMSGRVVITHWSEANHPKIK